MNLSRCEKGHFYDKEKFASCPHCASGGQKDESMTTVFTEDLNGGLGVTEPLNGAMTSKASQGTPIPVPNMGDGMLGGGVSDVTETVAKNPQDALGNTVSNVLNSQYQQQNQFDQDDDHTVAYYDELFLQPENQGKSQAAPGVARVTSPCTGWLIALGGEHIGQDFRLKAGKNFIGRDKSMDIVLDGDKSVSRNKHAILVYEPKAHLYLVQPGESSELVYLNNEVVLNPMKLTAYDMITVGEVNLLFMPLCGEKFNWNDILVKK